jgi:hypothetical protein
VGYEDILLAMNFDPADAKIVAEEIRATRRGHAG